MEICHATGRSSNRDFYHKLFSSSNCDLPELCSSLPVILVLEPGAQCIITAFHAMMVPVLVVCRVPVRYLLDSGSLVITCCFRLIFCYFCSFFSFILCHMHVLPLKPRFIPSFAITVEPSGTHFFFPLAIASAFTVQFI